MIKHKKYFMTAILMLVLLTGCGKQNRDMLSTEHLPTVPSVQVEEDAEEEDELAKIEAAMKQDSPVYIVIDVDTDNQTMVFGAVDSARTFQYDYNDRTQILDKYGDYMSASSLRRGRAVSLGPLDSMECLTRVQITDEAWYQENITRYEIDTKIGMLKIGDTKYHVNENARVFSKSSEIALEQIGEDDTICVQGIDKEIISIRVTKGHGTLALMNTRLFEGGWLSLGTKIYTVITPNMTLEVPEGTYQLSVANDGYGDTKKIKVKRSKVTTVDLEEYKGEGPLVCQMTFEVNVPEALLYIDGQETDYSKPVELRYGIHKLTVIASGFDTWERQLVVHSQTATIEIGEPQLKAEENKETKPSAPSTVTSPAGVTSASALIDATGRLSADYLGTLANLIQSLAGD